MSHPASKPPELSGYEFIDVLGSGGYADVYLYEQAMPRRRVAVKVLRSQTLTDSLASQFTSEANLMAALSAHPYIVTIFGAAVADDGRPYLVMEYYPGANLSVRCRQKPLGVPEALRLGVQIAGAVETAHRAGILHRDLKPANVLTSAFGKPGLTDFGISAVKNDGMDAGGVSIPWSPPELLDDTGEADERSDVYSLAATVYTLLAGRSPFETAGADNSALALMARIERASVPHIDRSDVPASLQRVLAGAMAKDREGRPARASDFARALQSVERELRLQPTDMDIPDDEPAPTATGGSLGVADEDGTRFRGAVSVDAQPAGPFAPPPRPHADSGQSLSLIEGRPVPAPPVPAQSLFAPGADAGMTVRRGTAHHDQGTVRRAVTVPDPADPVRPGPREVEPPPIDSPPSRRGLLLVVGGLVALAVVGIGAVLVLGRGDASAIATPTSSSVYNPNQPDVITSPPAGVRSSRSGTTVTFSWSVPPDGGTFTCERRGTGDPTAAEQTSCSFPDVPSGEKLCVIVQHYTPDGGGSPQPVTKCDPT